MAYFLFVNNATFSWRATLSQIVALSTTKAELMVALRVCFIQQLIQDGIINAKQCPTAAQIADIGTKALPRVPFESFTDQLLGDKHIGGN